MLNYGEALKNQRELRNLSQTELAKATGLKQQMISHWEANKEHEIVVKYGLGDHVRIMDGPLASFTGVVEEIEPEKNRVSVMVSMFGRETPVDLELDQVEVLN